MEKLEGRPHGLGRERFRLRLKKDSFLRFVVSLTLLCIASGPARALDPNQAPGGNFDLSHWYLGIPTAPSSIPAAQLTAGYSSAWFFTGPDGAMVFWCPVSGGTTANSSYPRSELREQINPPDNSVNWPAQGTHILEAQCKLTVLPSTGKIIIGQIHSYLGDARPLLKLVFNNGMIDAQVKESPSDDPDLHFSFPNVPANSLITYRILFADGLLSMTVNGVTRSVNVYDNDPDWESQTFYFKAGSYVQDNSGPSSEGGRVEFYQLSASHFDSAAVPPTITSQPASQSVDEGTTVAFNVTATGTPPLNYQWQRNDVPLVESVDVRGTTTASLFLSNVQLAQAGIYSVVVSKGAESVTSSSAVLAVTPVLALAEALDATSLGWTTNGSPFWIGQSLDTHDGIDAARSGAIGDSKTTSLQTTVVGPGTVSFWWKVSSEINKDYLIFYVGSAEQARISGEVTWQPRTFNLPSGSQVLKWTYSKNSSATAGQDRGWVDGVQFQPQPPAITRQPVSQSVDAGTTVILSVAATGTPPLSYQWRLDGNNLGDGGAVRGSTTATLTLANVPLALAGIYSVVVGNTADSVSSSDALLTVNPVVPLAEALETPPAWVWLTSGTPPWVGQSNVSQDGVDAARSGAVTDGQSTSMQTTVVGPGTVSFWWKVSSEPGNDRLLFYVGSSEKARITGESNWHWRTFSISSGNQTLKWTYSKNSSKSAGLDRGFIDGVLFVPANVPTAPIIVVQPVSQSVEPQRTVMLTVGATGSTPLGYQWQFNGNNVANGGGVSGATTATLTLANVQPARAGTYSVVVNNAVSSVPSADALLAVSPVLPLAEALDAPGLVWTTIGSPPWIGQTSVKHDGEDAARSGIIGDSKTTSMQAIAQGPGTVNFWWKVSSQPSDDRLLFYVNSSEKARITGTVDWQWRTFNVSSGTQTLRWTYSKNSSTSVGLDRGWVDEVEFLPAIVPVPFFSTITSAPAVPGITVADGTIILTWNAAPGKFYQVLYKDSLSDADWQLLAAEVGATGSFASVTDIVAGQPQRFYRVIEE